MTAGLDQLDRLDFRPEAVLSDAVRRDEDLLTDLNRSQLDRGLDSDGGDLGTYKVFAYKNRFEPVDLKDTGAFRESFYVDPFAGGFEVGSTDSKTEELEDKYGDAITGVPESEYDTVGELLADALIDHIRATL